MKKCLLLILAALTALMAAPTARAFEKHDWHDVEKTLHQLYLRMDAVKADRDRFGSGPRLKDQFAQLKIGIDDLTYRVQNRAGDVKVARKKSENLSDLMSEVEAEYRARAHHAGVVIKIYPG